MFGDKQNGNLSAIFLPNPLGTSSLLLAAISKRLELQGPGCTRQLGRSEISDFNTPGVEISAFNAFNAFATTKK